jgi:hypothetical protein
VLRVLRFIYVFLTRCQLGLTLDLVFFCLQFLLLFSNCFFIITLVIRTGISQILNKYLDKFLKNYMNIKY